MRQALVALVLSIALVPSAAGFHLSVGSQDSAAVSPSETQGSPDVGEDLYARGLGETCQPDASLEAGSASVEEDPFCGRLVYNEDAGDLRQESPPDQRHPMQEWFFDVVVTQYVGTYELDTCYPWCAPGGTTARDLVDGTLHETFPGVFSATHAGESGSTHTSYAVDVRTPNGAQFVQERTGAKVGSGWMLPTTDPQFVGFLEDGQGDPIDATELSKVVSAKEGSDLPFRALSTVCGFSPEIDSVGPTEDLPLTRPLASACDVQFEWQTEGVDDDFGPDGDDRCSSATYVCGTATPAWYGQMACKGWAGCHDPHEAGDPWHSTGDYDVWHFVVAPTISACGGQQEPGFVVDPGQTGTLLPYLAHDLDVYTPPSAIAAEPAPTHGAQAASERWLEPVEAAVDTSSQIDPVESAEGLPGPAPPPEPADRAYRSVVKPEIPEPNAEGDSSKSIEIPRSPGDCSTVGPTAETDRTRDPWVDQIDTTQRFMTWQGMDGTQAAAYLNPSGDQDENNRPGPGFFLSDGKVGLFADKDDDGEYDKASAEQLVRGIYEVGAYPMFYDMRLDASGNPDGGCTEETAFTDKPLAEAMADAGYGPRTGLVEAIYLEEPTAVFDRLTGDVYPFPAGNVVFVAKTQSVKVLEELGDGHAEDLVEDAIAETGAPQDARVVPLEEVKPTLQGGSDFWSQCGEDTGRYVQQLMFWHDCSVDCSGDTIVTKYMFEATGGGVLGGDGGIPPFQPDGQTGYAFPAGVNVWTDVDPFDNDPDRTTNDGTPPH